MFLIEGKKEGENLTPITVLMSVFNNERWLKEVLNSVLEQTFENFEFIIINDGSTDNSLNILKDYEAIDSRISLFNKPNTGIADSLNLGIMNANGKWIARIDADDICEPDRLAKQYQLAESSKNAVLIGSFFREIDELSRQGKTFQCPTQDKKLKYNLIFGKSFIAHPSAFILTAAIREVGGYRSRVPSCDDHDLWLRLIPHGSFYCVPEPLVNYRRHNDQHSNVEQGKRQRIEHILTLVAFHLVKLGEQDPFSYSDDEFKEFYSWIENNLLASNYFNYLFFLRSLKQRLSELRISYFHISGIFIYIFTHPLHTIKLIKRYFLGIRFPVILAKRWRDHRYYISK